MQSPQREGYDSWVGCQHVSLSDLWQDPSVDLQCEYYDRLMSKCILTIVDGLYNLASLVGQMIVGW